VLVLGFFLIFLLLGRSSPESALLAEVADSTRRRAEITPEPGWAITERLAKPIGVLRNLFGGAPNPELARRLLLAGYRQPFHADLYVGARLLLPAIVGIGVALWVRNNVVLWFALAIITSFFFPEFWLSRAILQRRERIRRSLPDALDLLSICMEAGLGLDQAIVRIGQELKVSHPELSEEFLQVNLEQRAGHPRIGAWRNLADRVNEESVRSFVNMLVQTERFGTPISRSLGAFSDALRTKRRQRAEEQAAKTTIKLVLPLVFFIFPCIFIVTVLPAIITVMKGFRVLGH
jgi:tight adherence protein C